MTLTEDLEAGEYIVVKVPVLISDTISRFQEFLLQKDDPVTVTGLSSNLQQSLSGTFESLSGQVFIELSAPVSGGQLKFSISKITNPLSTTRL